jgi:hypothetical protein
LWKRYERKVMRCGVVQRRRAALYKFWTRQQRAKGTEEGKRHGWWEAEGSDKGWRRLK